MINRFKILISFMFLFSFLLIFLDGVNKKRYEDQIHNINVNWEYPDPNVKKFNSYLYDEYVSSYKSCISQGKSFFGYADVFPDHKFKLNCHMYARMDACVQKTTSSQPEMKCYFFSLSEG